MTLGNNSKTLYEVREFLSDTSGRIKSKNLTIQQLKDRVGDLKDLANELRENATNIKIRDVGGALDKIKEAGKDSQHAQDKVDGTDKILRDSERVRQRTENLISSRKRRFDDLLEDNAKNLAVIEDDVAKLHGDMSDINRMVCGEPGDPCSALCGGAGCDRCGNTGCEGAVTIAQTANSLAQQAEDLLERKSNNVSQDLIPQIQDAHRDSVEAKMDAQEAYDEASKAKNFTEGTKKDLENLLKNVRDYLVGKDTAKPEDVEKLANEALALEIPLKPEKIQELADKISRAVNTTSDIEGILNRTAQGRNIAETLKKEAEAASTDAQNIRQTAKDVRTALDQARDVQARVEDAIAKAKQDIMDAENDLANISKTIGEVDNLSLTSMDVLKELRKRVDDLAVKYTEIKVKTAEAENEADQANSLAQEALDKAKELDMNYGQTSQELNKKYNETKEAKELAKKLKAKAQTIYELTFSKMRELEALEDKLNGNTGKISKLEGEIERLNRLMDEYLKFIKARATYYDGC